MFYAICHSILNTRFAYYVCKTIPFAYFSTATALPSMTQGDLNNNTIVIPPNEEQDSIVAFIDTVSTKIDDYITIKQNQINTLKEYKTTLIDAAVTGKIKVI
jgi:type I restriction enzyme S subunit